MRRIANDYRLAADPSLVRYSPSHVYTFRMPNNRWRNFFFSFLILGTPGLIFLVTYKGGIPDPGQILAVVIFVALILGFVGRVFSNNVVQDLDRLVIHHDHHDFTVYYRDIEDAFLTDFSEDIDDIYLPEGHYPMEFESRNSKIVVLMLRDGTISESTSAAQNGILTKVVSFNTTKPKKFMAFLRMRI